jgi:hypothetical protein
MLLSLALLLPVYAALAWIDVAAQRSRRGRYRGVDLASQAGVVALTVAVVAGLHLWLHGEPGIWPVVLPPLAGYPVLLSGWALALWLRRR